MRRPEGGPRPEKGLGYYRKAPTRGRRDRREEKPGVIEKGRNFFPTKKKDGPGGFRLFVRKIWVGKGYFCFLVCSCGGGGPRGARRGGREERQEKPKKSQCGGGEGPRGAGAGKKDGGNHRRQTEREQKARTRRNPGVHIT